ncbi:MAG: hypothetical protein LBQ40_02600 [Clostridiales bacterium]|jgi:hypothetical protein|nr:hypothetical protein [Clostridiales bacterium]
MKKSGMLAGMIIGATAAALIVNSKRSAESLIKKGKSAIKSKVDEILE